jgi:hypothetical protein
MRLCRDSGDKFRSTLQTLADRSCSRATQDCRLEGIVLQGVRNDSMAELSPAAPAHLMNPTSP